MPKQPKNKKLLTFTAKDEMQRIEKLLPKAKHPPGTPPTLVVDGANLAYAARYAYRKLSYKGKSTALLFGVPQMIKSVILNYKPGKIVVCWEGARSPLRLKWNPNYKGHRDAKRDPDDRKKFEKEIKRLRKLLYRMGIPQCVHPDCEGDDMIYKVVKKEVVFAPVIIVSGDKDFIQLVNHDISVLNPRDKFKTGTFAFSCRPEGVELPQYLDWLILVGDSSDDIKGVPGIGPKRAKDFLMKWYSIKDYLKDKKGIFPGLEDKEELEKLYKKNRKLMDLAYFDSKFNSHIPITYYKDNPFPQWDQEKYVDICNNYNLKTMKAETFINYFKIPE